MSLAVSSSSRSFHTKSHQTPTQSIPSDPIKDIAHEAFVILRLIQYSPHYAESYKKREITDITRKCNELIEAWKEYRSKKELEAPNFSISIDEVTSGKKLENNFTSLANKISSLYSSNHFTTDKKDAKNLITAVRGANNLFARISEEHVHHHDLTCQASDAVANYRLLEDKIETIQKQFAKEFESLFFSLLPEIFNLEKALSQETTRKINQIKEQFVEFSRSNEEIKALIDQFEKDGIRITSLSNTNFISNVFKLMNQIIDDRKKLIAFANTAEKFYTELFNTDIGDIEKESSHAKAESILQEMDEKVTARKHAQEEALNGFRQTLEALIKVMSDKTDTSKISQEYNHKSEELSKCLAGDIRKSSLTVHRMKECLTLSTEILKAKKEINEILKKLNTYPSFKSAPKNTSELPNYCDEMRTLWTQLDELWKAVHQDSLKAIKEYPKIIDGFVDEKYTSSLNLQFQAYNELLKSVRHQVMALRNAFRESLAEGFKAIASGSQEWTDFQTIRKLLSDELIPEANQNDSLDVDFEALRARLKSYAKMYQKVERLQADVEFTVDGYLATASEDQVKTVLSNVLKSFLLEADAQLLDFSNDLDLLFIKMICFERIKESNKCYLWQLSEETIHTVLDSIDLAGLHEDISLQNKDILSLRASLKGAEDFSKTLHNILDGFHGCLESVQNIRNEKLIEGYQKKLQEEAQKLDEQIESKAAQINESLKKSQALILTTWKEKSYASDVSKLILHLMQFVNFSSKAENPQEEISALQSKKEDFDNLIDKVLPKIDILLKEIEQSEIAEELKEIVSEGKKRQKFLYSHLTFMKEVYSFCLDGQKMRQLRKNPTLIKRSLYANLYNPASKRSNAELEKSYKGLPSYDEEVKSTKTEEEEAVVISPTNFSVISGLVQEVSKKIWEASEASRHDTQKDMNDFVEALKKEMDDSQDFRAYFFGATQTYAAQLKDKLSNVLS